MSDTPVTTGNGAGNAGGEPPAGSDNPEELLAMASIVAGIVKMIVPSTPDNIAIQLAQMAVAEAGPLGQVINDLQGEKLEKFPVWGFVVEHQSIVDDKGKPRPLVVAGPKNLTPGVDLNDALRSIQILALATSPMARAVCRAIGFRLSFMQSPAPKQSGLILPG